LDLRRTGGYDRWMTNVTIATDAELDAVVALVNSGYRGESSRAGWTTEADYLGGQRTDAETLRAELAASAGAVVLVMRDDPDGPLLACVRLDPVTYDVWYLGMLTVDPRRQDRKLGRTLLGEAERFVASRGARTMRMSVIGIRAELIAWYERRGYVRTGKTVEFPYGDPRFGEPRGQDLTLLVLEKPV
jgi:ribosomal protein S18 acetylase RimI-like enzyme